MPAPDLGESHRQTTLQHWLRLYDNPVAGPEYVRQAVRDYINLPGCPYPRIGHDFKELLDGRDSAETTK